MPFSKGTSGRRSGGITGMTVITIHCGSLPEDLSSSASLSRLMIFSIFCLALVDASSSRNSLISRSMSRWRMSSWAASAPIIALKSSPYFSCALRYCSSVSTSMYSSGVVPGSVTMYFWK